MSLERDFSKKLAGDLRQETADKLRASRRAPTKFSELKKTIKGKEGLPEEYDSWSPIKENFEALKKNIFGNIFKTEKFKKQETILNQYLKSKKESDVESTQKEYSKKLNEIFKNCTLTEEERKQYLSTEAMEQMSLEDYLTLTKRLSGEAFYHVTRYGVRENTFVSTGGDHIEGQGSFMDNLNPLLKDGYINSATSTIIKDQSKARSLMNQNKEAIKSFKEEGMSVDAIVDKFMGSYGTDYFLDRESTHFSYGKDLNHMYGGENDYKFYFYYPVEYILQNDFLHKTRERIHIGQGYTRNSAGIDQQYNDFEVFNFGKGVPVNAGILCIEGDVEVDPNTGSQYLLKDGHPIKDENGALKKPEHTISSKEYWEKYFGLHPELKPSKIIYSTFSTWTYSQNTELQEWAESKKVSTQSEDKKAEIDEYVTSSREEIRKVFGDIIKDMYPTL